MVLPGLLLLPGTLLLLLSVCPAMPSRGCSSRSTPCCMALQDNRSTSTHHTAWTTERAPLARHEKSMSMHIRCRWHWHTALASAAALTTAPAHAAAALPAELLHSRQHGAGQSLHQGAKHSQASSTQLDRVLWAVCDAQDLL